MRFSKEYELLQKQLHADGNYGLSGHKHAARIADMANRMGTRSVLDYGCGQRTLANAMPFRITSYDPFVDGYDADPESHDLVVCGDVLEHIEPDFIDSVLEHLRSKVGKVLFVDVAVRPAKKILADGRNAHLIQEPGSWWLKKMFDYFEITYFQEYKGGFIAVFVPYPGIVHDAS